MVSQELLSELRAIFLEEFGLSLTVSEVSEIATTLLEYIELLAKMENIQTQNG